MGSQFDSPFNYQANKIQCQKCGQDGAIVWNGAQFIEIIGGFYERIEKKPPYAIELVCGECGSIQYEDDSADGSPPHRRRQPGLQKSE